MDPADIQIKVTSPDLSEPALTALTTYTQGLYDADQMLGDLAGWIDQRERPTVLQFFGDHLPTLGPNYMAYNETGFVNTGDLWACRWSESGSLTGCSRKFGCPCGRARARRSAPGWSRSGRGWSRASAAPRW